MSAAASSGDPAAVQGRGDDQQQQHQRSFMSVISLTPGIFEAAEAEAAAASPDSQLDHSLDSLSGRDQASSALVAAAAAAVDDPGYGAGAADKMEPPPEQQLQHPADAGGGGGAASSDEGLISGEEEEAEAVSAAEVLNEAAGEEGDEAAAEASSQPPSQQPPSRGTFRRKFEASLRRKAEAESAEMERRRSSCASGLQSMQQQQPAASAIASLDDAVDGADAAPSVAMRSSELRQRLENSVRAVSEVNRSSSSAKSDPSWRPAVRCLTQLSGGGGGVGGLSASPVTAATPPTAAPPPSAPPPPQSAPPPASAGWRVEGGGATGEPKRFLFGEPSMSLGYLAGQTPAAAAAAAAASATSPEAPRPAAARPEISLPTGHIQETRKEGSVRVTRLPSGGVGGRQQQSGKRSSGHSQLPSAIKSQAYRLLLTGPDLVFFRSGKSDKKPEFALNVAATEILAPPATASPPRLEPSADAETDMRLRYPVGPEPTDADLSMGRYSHLYPSGGDQDGSCDLLLHWDDPKQRKEWSVALRYAQDLLTARMYSRAPGPLIDWSAGGGVKRSGIAQRLNEFFRRRPTLHDLVDRGIVRNEPVFGSTLRLICQQEGGSEVPSFLRRCILAIESHGLGTEGIYRLGGNAATVQKLRLLVDQSEEYDLANGWEIHVLTSALKMFFRELKEPLITDAVFELISNHYRSGIKPSAKREAIKLALHSLPPHHYASMRFLFHHLAAVVSRSDESQMNSQNLAMMFGPNLVCPDTGGAMCLTSNLMYQSQVIEYILLDAEFMFSE